MDRGTAKKLENDEMMTSKVAEILKHPAFKARKSLESQVGKINRKVTLLMGVVLAFGLIDTLLAVDIIYQRF